MIALIAAAALAAAPAPIGGHWLTPGGEAVVEVAPCGAALCGRIVRVVKPRPGPQVDARNPDPALRGRPIIGLVILAALRPDADRWRGRIYDPESGRTYRAEVARGGTALKVKGCFGPFCRSQLWAAAR
ncbi:DUF2147 domain-containing protein [Sphingomonas bacterium]|uniref:DUF2147 domain-containing protein n=1 Tax=Sphingomonas bacterium TaxID=1895847 RepID=UPI001576BB06|nr:DUF2147 domain-containing protein [Sphingomonas bacterium]